jgi:hypothetical protein
MVVSATQIRVRSVVGLVRFMISSRGVLRQLNGAPGLLFAEARGFRTLTGWENRAAMVAFRNNGAHLAAMKLSGRIGRVKSVTWESGTAPSWAEARERLRDVPWIA